MSGQGAVGGGQGWDALSQASHWDAKTRELVLDRVHNVPPIRFFTAEEARTLRAFCDVVTAQDGEPRIEVLNYVDEKMFEGRLDGFQYADMPDDRDVWRQVARHLDDEAGGSYADAAPELQRAICSLFADGRLDWELPVDKAWKVVTRGILSCFYAHPYAWNEIGFPGPAYPRGYSALGVDGREQWEPKE
ncbi:MAG TPA: gluconate 2-dehydrogenase subunit 3 family protein [Thermoleophilaceae bacterium]|jgi:hypothetical protein|nr:gluconate 2-dehydrogenase subunit 3 family protein [Thermoleophilaceae bacterium]